MNNLIQPGWGPWQVQVLRGKRFEEGVDETNDYLRGTASRGREVEKEVVVGPDGNLSFIIWYRDPLVLEEKVESANASSVSNPPAVDTAQPFKIARDQWLDHLEREYLKALIQAHGRDVSIIATISGLDKSYVLRLMRKHGL